jgi:hypothetical protein
MATRPAVFTVAPWGYRLLTPTLVEAWPVRTVRAFRDVTAAGLVVTGALLFLWLRRLGNGEWASLLAVLAFSLSGPVGEAVRYRFLVEPVTAALLAAFLLALAAGAPLTVLAFVATLGTLSKEFFLLLVPLVFFERRRSLGFSRALAATALVALPPLVLTAMLRYGWTPYLQAPLPQPGGALLATAWLRFSESFPDWRLAALMGGLTVLAIAGAFLPRGRSLAVAGAYLFLVTLLPPFINPVGFFANDIHRLLIYALPAALALALVALDRVAPHIASGPAPWRAPAWLSWTAGAATLVVIVGTWARVDPYRRVDLQAPRDGPLTLAVCRESLRTATRLERGETVSFDMADQVFKWGETPLFQFDRMRWLLREGWGERPQYASGDAVVSGPEARVLLPVLVPRDMSVVLEMAAPSAGPMTASVNGNPVGTGEVLRIPAAALYRGDNVLSLVVPAGSRLRRLELRP